MPTSRSLGVASALALFVAAGCVNWVPESKGATYWAEWAFLLPRLVAGEYAPSAAWDLLVGLGMFAVVLGVPSVVLGWAVQAVVVVLLAAWRGVPAGSARSGEDPT